MNTYDLISLEFSTLADVTYWNWVNDYDCEFETDRDQLIPRSFDF